MAETKTERKVTVILAADVVGYSTKMEENEEQTLKNLKVCRNIVEGLVNEHHGRIFNTAGDSVLAEFQSAVEAVICGSEFQNTIRERNNSVPEEEQMEFRIGINMGDVVIEGDNLYGEGVNVAARLEALAQPGGVCLSKNVHEIVNKKTDFQFHDLGKQKVKNTVLHAVDVKLDGTTLRKLTQTQKISQTASWKKYSAVFILAALIAGGGVWWQQQPDFKPAEQSKFAFKLPDKPSIAVLPFNNMSGDASQDYLGDGLSENIIAVLATSPDLFVIARNSSFTYKGKAVKVQEVSEQLGVRYVLEGSVQQSGEKLRVTAQLVDAVDGKHLWAQRYDRKLDDLFAVQDEITEKIFFQMEVQLTSGARARIYQKYSGGVEDMRLIKQGKEHFHTYSPAGHKEAERLWRELYEKNPEGGMANAALGTLYWQKVWIRLSKNPKEDFALSRKYFEKAHSIMGDGTSLTFLALLDSMTGNCESSIEKVERAVQIDPSAGSDKAIGGSTLLNCGKPARSVELLKQAMRLQPYYPEWYANTTGTGMLAIGKHEEAEELLTAVLQSEDVSKRDQARALTGLAVSYVFRQDPETAKKYFRQLLELDPGFNMTKAKTYNLYKGKMADQEFVKRYVDALQQLGVPEKPTSG
jgi:TolB-like protein/class 3 adenylate cyclase